MHSQSQESPRLPGCLRPGAAAVEDSCTIDRRGDGGGGGHKSVSFALLESRVIVTAAL